MKMPRKIPNGIYLIANAGLEENILTKKLGEALIGGVRVVQLYNTEGKEGIQISKINSICDLCHQYDVPVLVNNNWPLLNQTELDGVHFDRMPTDFHEIENKIDREFIKGITCSNDLSIVRWANANGFDYISFCSMFPSPSVDTCEIVSFETVKKAKAMTAMPLFVAGGINLNNIKSLTELPVDGIAVISGIMASPDIKSTTEKYLTEFSKIRHHAN